MNRALENFTKVATGLGLILILKIFIECVAYYAELARLYNF